MVDLQKIWSSSQLPTLPSVAIRLLDLSRDPQAEIQQVVEVIKTDPAITAKLLKATNSSFFGFSAEITSIERAVPLLGTTAVTSLALSFSLHASAMSSGPLVEHYNAYWLQSVTHGAIAELLGKNEGQNAGGECFLAGLLMDIGRLAMLKTIPDEYLPVLLTARDEQRDLHEVETEQLGLDHAAVGAKLMEDWDIPSDLVAAVALHHHPLAEIEAHSGEPCFKLAQATAVAASTGDYFCAANKGPALQRLREFTHKSYGFCSSDVDAFLEKASARIEQAGHLFSLSTDHLPAPNELMAQANEQLAELAVRAQIASTQAVAKQQQAELEKEQLASRNERLQEQVLHDPLTRIYNRCFFDETLDTSIRRCCRKSDSIGVIFTDIDHFKKLNDTYGHQFGDRVLQQIAATLQRSLRQSDVVARYGGEEFVVIVEQPTEKGIEKLAERIRSSVESAEIQFDGERVPVTVSVGAAIAIPERVESDLAARLVGTADEAMYEAKQNGRNQICVRSLISEMERRLTQKVSQGRFSRWLVVHGVFDIPNVTKALLGSHGRQQVIGELACEQRFLDADQVDQILREQERSRERFGAIAMRLGLLTEDQLVQLLVLQQEDPMRLAKTLVSMKLIDVKEIAGLLREYLSECAPGCPKEVVGV